MQKKQLTPHEGIYTEDFENRVKEPIEYLQFLAWIKELIRITEALNATHDFINIDLFYIRIYELFDVFKKKKTNSVNVCKDSYTLYVKKCIEEMLHIMTDDEYITLAYYRHCAAHVFQSFYDLFDAKGQRKDVKRSIMIRGKEMQLSVEDIDRTLHRQYCYYYNKGTSFEEEILQKLAPFVEKLQEGWKDRAITHLTQMGFDEDSEQYKDLITP